MRRILLFILLFTFFLCFIILNLGNSCDINLGFKTFNDVPVFVSALFSFALGILFVLPMIFSISLGRKAKAAKEGRIAEEKSGRRQKLFKPKAAKKDEAVPDKIRKEPSPYGID